MNVVFRWYKDTIIKDICENNEKISPIMSLACFIPVCVITESCRYNNLFTFYE